MESSKTAIIVVNQNGLDYLAKCLEAIFNQTYKNFVIYFVDNASTDASVEFMQKKYPAIHLIVLQKNFGFAGGNNVAIKEALKDSKIQYIIFLNNDTIVDKDWLKELVIAADQDTSIGMVSSKSFFPDGTIQTVGLYLEKNIFGRGDGGVSIGFKKDGKHFEKDIEIFAPSGVSALYKREVLEEIGYFDENFFCYDEDLDLGLRARLHGWKCVYASKSKLIHLHSKTGGASSSFKAFYTKRNGYYVAIKCFQLLDLLLFPFRDFLSNIHQVFKKNKIESVKKLQSTIGILGIIKIYLRVYVSVLFNFPIMMRKRIILKKSIKISKDDYAMLFKKFSEKGRTGGIA